MIPYVKNLEGWKVALVNYRGFGISGGSPGRQKVLDDALVIYDALSEREDIDPGRIVSMGYSLGTGVAVYLSAQRPTAGTILVAPYDKLTLIGFKQSPAYAPFAGITAPLLRFRRSRAWNKSTASCAGGQPGYKRPPGTFQTLGRTVGRES